MRGVTLMAAALALALGGAGRARAGVLALDFVGGVASFPAPQQTLGWEFSLSESKTLTALGLWDEGGDGLAEDHRVALWLPGGGAPLAQALVTGGATPVASAQPSGRWLFAEVAPVTLGPGTYVLGADYQTGADRSRRGFSPFPPIALSPAPGVGFVRGRFANPPTPAFDFPSAAFATPGGHFGPNARFADVAIPEPGGPALLGAAAVAAVAAYGVRWCRTRARAHAPPSAGA